jgi:hypothetical protein
MLQYYVLPHNFVACTQFSRRSYVQLSMSVTSLPVIHLEENWR